MINKFHVGLDVGSTTVKIVVIDSENTILFTLPTSFFRYKTNHH